MNEFMKKALHEFNMSVPADAPYYKYEQLSAANQSRVDLRAEELEMEALFANLEVQMGRSK